MKRNHLIAGIFLFIVGVLLLLVSYYFETNPFASKLFGIGCGWIGASIPSLYKFFHWSKPQNKPIYEARLKEEQINLKDERKIMLRQKSGQITYQIMFFVLGIVNIIFSLANIETWVVLVLWGVWVFQYICGLLVYRNLDKKL